jgi:hypothetical protein
MSRRISSYLLHGPGCRRTTNATGRSGQCGHSVLEMLVVISLLGICFAVGGVTLARGLGSLEARGAAQAWQAAGAWAQVGALWQGRAEEVSLDGGHLAVTAGALVSEGDLGACAPPARVTANVVRWQQGEGVVVRFLAGSAFPNSAGSLYFHAASGDYRVTVRLESGLTARSRVEAGG